MKLLLLFAFAIILASAAGKRSKEEEDKIAEEYFEKFNKNRGRSQKDIERRKRILIDRFNKIEEHNEKFLKGEELYEQGLNPFSDLTEEEIKENWTGVKFPEGFVPSNDTNPPLPKDSRRGRAAPTNWNWAQYTVVQPVQDQKQCGSCYAFAAVAALEGSMCRYFGQCTKISEQEAMECTRGCAGGWYSQVFEYSKSRGGCAYNSNYPYKGYVTKGCTSNGSRVPKSKAVKWMQLPNNADKIKEFVYSYGPVFVAFDVYKGFGEYKNGIFTGCSGSNGGGHAVLITGYGEENGNKYWIVKNSWGTWWGDKGYFKISRGRNCANIEGWGVAFPWTE